MCVYLYIYITETSWDNQKRMSEKIPNKMELQKGKSSMGGNSPLPWLISGGYHVTMVWNGGYIHTICISYVYTYICICMHQYIYIYICIKNVCI